MWWSADLPAPQPSLSGERTLPPEPRAQGEFVASADRRDMPGDPLVAPGQWRDRSDGGERRSRRRDYRDETGL